MPEAAQQKLLGFVPFCAPRNPVDCTAHVLNDTNLIGEFGEATVADGGYASVLAFFSQVGNSPTVAPKLRDRAWRGDGPPSRPALSCSRCWRPRSKLREYDADGWLVFEDPTRAVVAIEAMGRFGAAFADKKRRRPACRPSRRSPCRPPHRARPRAKAAAGRTRHCVGAGTAPVPPPMRAVAAAEEFGYPVVLKILSPDILHKTEIGGVLLGLADAQAVRAAFDTVMDAREACSPGRADRGRAGREASYPGGTECILGIHRDPVFGPIAMFGLGGIFVEVLQATWCSAAARSARTSRLEMISSIRTAPLLLGARGRPPADIAALARMLSRLSVFADQRGPGAAIRRPQPGLRDAGGAGRVRRRRRHRDRSVTTIGHHRRKAAGV